MNYERLNVLSHFDDGGWLILGFWLAARGAEHPFRVSIDSRSSVTGDGRLKEFDSLERLADNSCEILEQWRLKYAVLPRTMQLAQALEEQAEDDAHKLRCSGHWQVLFTEEPFIVLSRQ